MNQCHQFWEECEAFFQVPLRVCIMRLYSPRILWSKQPAGEGKLQLSFRKYGDGIQVQKQKRRPLIQPSSSLQDQPWGLLFPGGQTTYQVLSKQIVIFSFKIPLLRDLFGFHFFKKGESDQSLIVSFIHLFSFYQVHVHSSLCTRLSPLKGESLISLDCPKSRL